MVRPLSSTSNFRRHSHSFSPSTLLTCRWKNPYELKSHAIHSGIGSGKDAPVRRMVMPTTFMVVVFVVGDVGGGGLGFVVVVGGGRGDRVTVEVRCT